MTASMLGNAIALNLYVNREYLPSGVPYHFLLYPFWGMIPERVGDPDENRFMEYTDKGKELFAFTSKEVADFSTSKGGEGLRKTNYRFLLQRFCRRNTSGKRNCLSHFRIPLSAKVKRVWASGVVGRFFDLYLRHLVGKKKAPRPTVSYCGYIDYEGGRSLWCEATQRRNMARLGKNLVTRGRVQMFPDGPWLRGQAVRKLRKSKNIETRFIIRKEFSAREIPDAHAARREYADKILNADYALVVRREYRMLNSGRRHGRSGKYLFSTGSIP